MHRVLAGISEHGRLASAYLFVGPPGCAKAEDARAFAAALGCGRFDLVVVTPAGASLGIEQVRDLQARVRYGPAESAWLCVIVERADELTPDAAAACLKTLEEPPPRVFFILLVEREDRLPATIISRCQKITFGESEKKWEPQPALAEYYTAVKAARRLSVLELLALSARLHQEKTEAEGAAGLEQLLYDLAFFAREELRDIKAVRAILDGIKHLKKKANLKLALDNLCLRLGEA